MSDHPHKKFNPECPECARDLWENLSSAIASLHTRAEEAERRATTVERETLERAAKEIESLRLKTAITDDEQWCVRTFRDLAAERIRSLAVLEGKP